MGGFSINSLNREQRTAAGNLDGPVLILAGAGTGKTRTITCRIVNMLEVGIAAESILAVTFTNKAASEMRERIAGMVGKKRAGEMTICTFHSLCARILRYGIDRLGYKKNFSICSYGDQVGLMKQLIVRNFGKGENIKAQEVLTAISNAKNKGIQVEDILNQTHASLAVAYQNELRARNGVDFDDLLVLAELLLREHRDVREYFTEYYNRVTVDEFQDTNSLQMRLLQQLVKAPYHICVVGDDDQSIYGWRGAESKNILQFEQFFPNPKIIYLEQNYRSTEAILHTANSLIRHNSGRREKSLRSTIAGGEPVRLIAMPDDEAEAQFLADEIFDLKTREKLPWEDFAILLRTNLQSKKLEVALREQQIPYRMIGAQSFYDKREVKDLIAYLEVLNDPTADLALLRIINAPARGIGQATTIQAMEHSRLTNQSVWEALCDESFTSLLGNRARNSIHAFINQILGYKVAIESPGAQPNVVLNELLEEISYREWMKRNCKTSEEADKRMEAIYELLAQLADYMSKGKSIRRFLDSVALASERDEEELEKKHGVTIITLHAAKGLEFPIVYLVGLEEGILPHRRSIEEGTKEEERRLLYVGITRSQKKLTLSYCQTRTKWGKPEGCAPSTFLQELDDQYIIHTSWDDIMTAEASSDEMDNFFAEMDELFKD